jgi:hypothetical protein
VQSFDEHLSCCVQRMFVGVCSNGAEPRPVPR